MDNNYRSIKYFNTLNDYFVRYLFSDKGSEAILLDFINSTMLDAGMKTFRSVEILTPSPKAGRCLNYKENYEDKETITDVKCITQNGSVVIIEIQLQGNSRFPERILYYWASNYSKLLKQGEKYDDLTPVISINLLNFNLDDSSNIHSCYMIYDTVNQRLLTDHLQIHIIELKKFKGDLLKPNLNCWLKFFTIKEKDNKEVIMSEIVKEKPIMEEVQKRYNNFIKDRLMMNEYDKRQAYLYGKQIMLEEERRLGIEEGEKNKAISIARNFKKAGIDIKIISENTGLSIEEVENL
ncbi:Rpn family recombination-promoting nuclease/putative transposase [uncultured Brachyspira sp.]|nr:Rpn family recombination-promoting nuclease/putative transposase [uncultured Brachyspira sp.]